MAYSHKDRYKRLKALQICTNCGKAPARPGRITCEACYRLQKSYAAQTRSLPPAVIPKKMVPKYTLDEVSKMALDRGISYGQMVAILEQKGGRDGSKN